MTSNNSRRPNTSHDVVGHRERKKFESKRDDISNLDIELATSAKIRFDTSEDQGVRSVWNVHVVELGSYHRISKKVITPCCRGIRLVIKRVIMVEEKKKEQKAAELKRQESKAKKVRKEKGEEQESGAESLMAAGVCAGAMGDTGSSVGGLAALGRAGGRLGGDRG